jgi:hypothetical protein
MGGLAYVGTAERQPARQPGLGAAADDFRRQTPHGRRAQGYRRGAASAKAKFTAEEVATIRERYAAGGITQYQLADEYAVTQSCIGHLLTRRTYKDEAV